MPKYGKMDFPVSGVEKDKYEPAAEAKWKIRPLELGRSRGWSCCQCRYSRLLEEDRG